MGGALEGVRVLDLSTGIAGPLAGMLLADNGADVIKVEDPSGDPARRNAGFPMWNRNKRSIIGEFGNSRLEEFLAGADICITNAVDQPVGLADKYPHLIVLHMPPYAPYATPWPGGAESHGLLSAVAGTARRQSSFDGGPIELVYPLALYVQGAWAAATGVAALIERQRSGFGQVVTVAGVHGVMICAAGSLNIVPDQPPLPTNVGPGGRHPCYTTYQGGDGQWLFLAALTPKFQANAFKVLGVGNIFADERIGGVPARMLLPENRGWIRQRLTDAFRTRTRGEWLVALEEGDCPAGPLGERDEWLDHPQVHANDLHIELDDAERGPVVMPGVPVVLTKTPGSVRTRAPRLGEHTATAEPWSPRQTPAGVPPTLQRGPLAGIKVLDLGTILAGPYAGALLADLGADVIKVETPTGDAFRETGFVYNRGQRGLAIDLTSSSARTAFYELVRSSDAVIDNSRRGVPERLQVDYASLWRIKPDIVTLSITGFGEAGPLAHKPGFDPVLQAMSGMMKAQGGDCDPVLFTIPVNDIAAGALAVFGVCLGLFHRERHGEGQRIWTSLIGCSTFMQSGELVRFAGRQPAVRGARDFVGTSALDRFYQTRDGWVRIQAPDRASLGSFVRASDVDADLDEALQRQLASMCVADAVSCLQSAGVPAVAARLPADLISDPDLATLEMFATLQMQDGTPFYTPNRYARFSRTQECRVLTPPGVGEHSREVLTEVGVGDSEIDALVALGVLKEGTAFRIAGIQNYR